jgi:hypothetical protein
MVMKWEHANGGFIYSVRVFRHRLLFGHQPPYPTSVKRLLEKIIGLSQPSGQFLGFITTDFKKKISKKGFWYIPMVLKKKLSENCQLFTGSFMKPAGSF